MDRSACGAFRSLLPPGRSDSRVWAPMQAEVYKSATIIPAQFLPRRQEGPCTGGARRKGA